MTKIIIIIALVGHIVCGISDCLMVYGKKGRINSKNLKDSEKMAAEYEQMPLSNLSAALATGVYAITAMAFGYLALADWAEGFSHISSVIMYISAVIFIISIVVHHVYCALVLWFYVKLGRTPDAREASLGFLKNTSYTMITGYIAWITFAVTFFITVVSGQTPLPQWACVFNILPCYLVIAPTKLPAKANIAGAMMFLGLLFFI